MKSILELRDGNGPMPIRIEVMKFPGGEVNVSVPAMILGPSVTITVWLKDSDGVMALAQLKSILDGRGIEDIALAMGYVPYARQDRICNEGESLAIKIFADMINLMDFKTVAIFDPHSDVTPALFNRCYVVNKERILDGIAMDTSVFDCFVAPDAGASKEVQALAIKHGVEFIQGYKTRDTKTGKLSGFGYYGDVNGKELLIVDDICDGGGTFLGLAKELYLGTPKSISLYITHGMFTNGYLDLVSTFKTIYTTNSYQRDIKDTPHSDIECIYEI